MPSFSKRSLSRLSECHPDLQFLFKEVVKYFDCTIICGHRGEEEQNRAFKNNRSKLEYPKSKHNKEPSLAVDVVPYPVEWKNTKRMYLFAGYVWATAKRLGIDNLRLGCDWDSDTEINDQTFHDLPHFELV